jgi:hypothetical protein
VAPNDVWGDNTLLENVTARPVVTGVGGGDVTPIGLTATITTPGTLSLTLDNVSASAKGTHAALAPYITGTQGATQGRVIIPFSITAHAEDKEILWNPASVSVVGVSGGEGWSGSITVASVSSVAGDVRTYSGTIDLFVAPTKGGGTLAVGTNTSALRFNLTGKAADGSGIIVNYSTANDLSYTDALVVNIFLN